MNAETGRPAILGGTPVVPPGPRSAPRDPRRRPSGWPDVEDLIVDETGYRFAVCAPTSVEACAWSLRALMSTRGPAWAKGREDVLVPDLAPRGTYKAIQRGVTAALGRKPRGVNPPIVAVFLHGPPDELLRRVRERRGPGDHHVTRSLLEELADRYLHLVSRHRWRGRLVTRDIAEFDVNDPAARADLASEVAAVARRVTRTRPRTHSLARGPRCPHRR